MTALQYVLPSTINTHPVFSQWDKQANDPHIAWINLNNLYLAIERGDESCSIINNNQLYHWLSIAYSVDDEMRDYWLREFEKLPNWYLF